MADPVLWLKTDKPYAGVFRRARVWNEQTKQWDTPVYEKGHPNAGRPRMERVPGVGFEGTDIRAMRPMRQKRFVEYLRADGHEVCVPITNAAAHVPREDTSCERDRRLKGKFFAWIEKGKCPAMMLSTGELAPETIQADTKGWTGCHPGDVGLNKPPCSHYLAERRARQELRAAQHADTEGKYKSEATKHMESLQGLTQSLTDAMKQALLAGAATGGGAKK